MAEQKQLYTVKRIPAKDTGLRIDQWEILGPGAPEKRISVGPVAHMIRDAMEAAGQALLAEQLAKIDNAVGDLEEVHGMNGHGDRPGDWTLYFDGEDSYYTRSGETFTAALFADVDPVEEADRG